jgi:hypothetical protein
VNSLGELFGKASYFLNDNSASILTGVGVAGVITTSVLTGKAVLRADELIDNAHLERAIRVKAEFGDKAFDKMEPLTREEKLKLTWREFIPPIIMGTTTILAIVLANRLASKEIAALAAAYTISDKALQEYKEKVVEKLGPGKEQAIRDEIVAKKLAEHPVESSEIIIIGNGEVLCYDVYSGRYFMSSVEAIKQAENKINFEIVNCNYASLSAFYDELGLPPNGMSDVLGFNLDNRLEIKFSSHLSSDNRPCVAMEYHFPPVPDYGKHVY